MNTSLADDLQQHRNGVADLCRQVGARRLDLFGSATRDDFDSANSDLDFLVEFEELDPGRYADAYFELKNGLEHLFDRPIDLLTASNLGNPYFRQRVLAERLKIYER